MTMMRMRWILKRKNTKEDPTKITQFNKRLKQLECSLKTTVQLLKSVVNLRSLAKILKDGPNRELREKKEEGEKDSALRLKMQYQII